MIAKYTYEAVSALNPNIEFHPELERLVKRGSNSYLIIGWDEEKAVRKLDDFCYQMQEKNKTFTRVSKNILVTSEKLIDEVKTIY